MIEDRNQHTSLMKFNHLFESKLLECFHHSHKCDLLLHYKNLLRPCGFTLLSISKIELFTCKQNIS